MGGLRARMWVGIVRIWSYELERTSRRRFQADVSEDVLFCGLLLEFGRIRILESCIVFISV